MVASREHWKNSPFVAGEPLPYVARFSAPDYVKLCAGLVPEVMEDKWFVFFESPYLYFHRSWTGHAVYRVKIEQEGDLFAVTEALWDKELAQASPGSFPYQGELLDFLISNLLLGMGKPFPQPQGVPGPTGVLQHHISGTGYAEAPAKSRSWWRFLAGRPEK
jgi:hypothetical protein